MMSFSVLRPVVRRFIAAVAMFGFSLNVATPTIAHGCAHPGGAASLAMGAGATQHGHHSDTAPADASHGKKCQCVGHSCGTALAAPIPAAMAPRLVATVSESVQTYHADRLPAAAQHLLPFAVGPPGRIPA